jgi:hypothetical protein
MAHDNLAQLIGQISKEGQKYLVKGMQVCKQRKKHNQP